MQLSGTISQWVLILRDSNYQRDAFVQRIPVPPKLKMLVPMLVSLVPAQDFENIGRKLDRVLVVALSHDDVRQVLDE